MTAACGERRATLAAAVGILLIAWGAQTARAWGDESHQAVARGAVTALPADLRPFFLVQREFIARHATDPDYIPNRTRAQAAEHFLDIDEYGQPPFDDLSHDRAELEKQFGAETVEKRGLLPWAIEREFNRLVKAFQAKDSAEIRLAAAHLSHFVADAHMPLHATRNYDGQLSGNAGIHIRFEAGMMPRYHNSPVAPADDLFAIDHPVEWTFREIAISLSYCKQMLTADTEARELAPLDTEAYYAELNRRLEALARLRLREATTAVGSFVAAAWEKAGRPALPPAQAVVILCSAGLDGTPLPAGGRPAQALAARLAAMLQPFDAVAAGEMDAPRRQQAISIGLNPAGEARTRPQDAVQPLGGLKYALPQANRALLQLPRAARHILLITNGWKDEPAIAEAASAVKRDGALLWVFAVGKAETFAAGRQLAEQAGGRAFMVERFADLAPLLSQALAPELQPVDAP